MRTLVDTNVLVRLVQLGHPLQAVALAAVHALNGRGHDLCVVPQVIYEFWVACTRPTAVNGLGMEPGAVKAEIDRGRPLFPLVADIGEIYDEWERLVVEYAARGKPAHDARLVAAMRVHGVPALLTFNTADFARYSDIGILSPDVAAHAGGLPGTIP